MSVPIEEFAVDAVNRWRSIAGLGLIHSTDEKMVRVIATAVEAEVRARIVGGIVARLEFMADNHLQGCGAVLREALALVREHLDP
jgi:hypothetical protein